MLFSCYCQLSRTKIKVFLQPSNQFGVLGYFPCLDFLEFLYVITNRYTDDVKESGQTLYLAILTYCL